MRVGLMIPQGFKHEYDGWGPAEAWARAIELTKSGEQLGFESLWVFDHLHTAPESTDDITFESFTMLAAMAMVTSRVRLGHMVICAGFRNPGLTAKLASTIDVISNGRFELGIGAGWLESEWRAYGFGFPSTAERMDQLGEQLEIITRLLGPGRGTFEGRHASIQDAINEPKGIQPRIPLIVGGNGRVKIADLAAKFGDELNLFDLGPEEVAIRIQEVRERCEKVGRDPDTLHVSMYSIQDELREAGQRRVDYVASFAGVGVERLVCFPVWGPTREGQAAFAKDCQDAGVTLVGS